MSPAGRESGVPGTAREHRATEEAGVGRRSGSTGRLCLTALTAPLLPNRPGPRTCQPAQYPDLPKELPAMSMFSAQAQPK